MVVFWLMPGCGGEEKPERPPGRVEADGNTGEVLKRRFADASLPRQARLAAGGELLRWEDGAAFLASRYRSSDRALVRALLDSLAAEDRVRAARLAAGLLEVAGGEEKLDFEVLLLQQGKDAVVPLIRLVSKRRDWQTVVRALDALGKLKAREGVVEMAACLNDSNTWGAHGCGACAGRGGRCPGRSGAGWGAGGYVGCGGSGCAGGAGSDRR